MELDAGWLNDPIIRVISVVGQGYWNFSEGDRRWAYQPATETFDEVLILLAQLVNTLARRPVISDRPAPIFGDYVRPPDKG